ncbi:hypothetical protein TNCV_4150691 [Trichonephila clavipes]|nr:hypothetical protein TNCV_4150691 [Trichonephila clavipes]
MENAITLIADVMSKILNANKQSVHALCYTGAECNSVSTLRNSSIVGERCPVGKLPLECYYELQYYRLNYQTDVQICSRYVWDNHMIVPTVIGKCCMVVIGTKSKNCCYQRKHSRSQFHPSMGSGLTSQCRKRQWAAKSEEIYVTGCLPGAIVEVTDI